MTSKRKKCKTSVAVWVLFEFIDDPRGTVIPQHDDEQWKWRHCVSIDGCDGHSILHARCCIRIILYWYGCDHYQYPRIEDRMWYGPPNATTSVDGVYAIHPHNTVSQLLRLSTFKTPSTFIHRSNQNHYHYHDPYQRHYDNDNDNKFTWCTNPISAIRFQSVRLQLATRLDFGFSQHTYPHKIDPRNKCDDMIYIWSIVDIHHITPVRW